MSTMNHQLSVPANRTVTGPRFRKDGNQIIVEYDYERDDGAIEWSHITFDEVLAFEYRQMACCRETDIVGSHEVRVMEQSQYLLDVLGRWEKAVGWQEWHQQRGGIARFKHFTGFFDDAGCINVVAATLS